MLVHTLFCDMHHITFCVSPLLFVRCHLIEEKLLNNSEYPFKIRYSHSNIS